MHRVRMEERERARMDRMVAGEVLVEEEEMHWRRVEGVLGIDGDVASAGRARSRLSATSAA